MTHGRLPFGLEPGDWCRPIVNGQIALWPGQVSRLDYNQGRLCVRLMDGRILDIGDVLWTRARP